MLIELDDVHVAHARGEVLGEHAESAADLEHDVPGLELGGPLDHAEDVRVDQEVLPELAVRSHAEAPHPTQARLHWLLRHREPPGAHQPNTRAALRSTAAPSSAGVVPRSSATNASVCTTKAG